MSASTGSGTGPAASPALAAVTARANRKIAIKLLPLLLVAFFITFVDRGNLAIVAPSMSKDLGLSPSTFGLAAGLFYIGYLIFEIPSNVMLERFGARVWIARIMISWGIVSGLTVFVWNDISLNIVRILLGVGEAGFYPGVLLYLGYWFARRERDRSWLLFQLGLPLSLALGSLFTSSLLNLDGVLSIAGWRWVFIIEALLTIGVGLAIYFILPNKPREASWLTKDELAAVEAQVVQLDHERERLGHGWAAFLLVLRNGVAWYSSILFFCMLCGFLTVTYWAPTIVAERFDTDEIGSGLLSAIPWVVSALSLLISARLVSRTGKHTQILVGVMIICAIGMVLASQAENAVVALIGLCLAACMQAGVPLLYTFPRNYFPATLAAISLAFVNSLGNLSGLAGPLILGFFVEQTGDTRSGLLALSSFFVVAAVLAACAPAFIRWQQRRNLIPAIYADEKPAAAAG